MRLAARAWYGIRPMRVDRYMCGVGPIQAFGQAHAGTRWYMVRRQAGLVTCDVGKTQAHTLYVLLAACVRAPHFLVSVRANGTKSKVARSTTCM